MNTGNVFFTIFLYTKFYDWWWDWMPKYLFFLLPTAAMRKTAAWHCGWPGGRSAKTMSVTSGDRYRKTEPAPPRYQVELIYGRRFEPWIAAVMGMGGKGG